MQGHKVLFTAPFDFDPAVMDEYRQKFAVNNTFDMLNRRAEAWVCNPKANFVIGDQEFDAMPSLRILATPSTGTNHIDLDACARRNIRVISLLDDRDGLETISASAEFTFKLLLDALRLSPARELQGKCVGLVGLGRIGRRLRKWCQDFGARVYYSDPRIPDSEPLERLFNCDAVIICCALTPETRNLVSADLLRLLPQGAALINTARGEVIDEDALVQVMQERPDLRVAVDVLAGEVTGTANPERLRKLGAIVTPHIAGETYDSRTKAARIILRLLERELGNE